MGCAYSIENQLSFNLQYTSIFNIELFAIQIPQATRESKITMQGRIKGTWLEREETKNFLRNLQLRFTDSSWKNRQNVSKGLKFSN